MYVNVIFSLLLVCNLSTVSSALTTTTVPCIVLPGYVFCSPFNVIITTFLPSSSVTFPSAVSSSPFVYSILYLGSVNWVVFAGKAIFITGFLYKSFVSSSESNVVVISTVVVVPAFNSFVSISSLACVIVSFNSVLPFTFISSSVVIAFSISVNVFISSSWYVFSTIDFVNIKSIFPVAVGTLVSISALSVFSGNDITIFPFWSTSVSFVILMKMITQ